jgi:hypothetical protein
MSSEMVRKQQAVDRTAHFKIPLTLVAGLLIAIGLFFAYKGLHFPSSEVVALKAEHQKEAPRLSSPAELKPSSSIVTAEEKKKEEARPYENASEKKPAPVFYAEVAVNDAVGEFLSDTTDDVLTDKKKIGELVAMLAKDNKTIGAYDISEVRLERGETLMRSSHSSTGKAEIRINNGVLTIKLVD